MPQATARQAVGRLVAEDFDASSARACSWRARSLVDQTEQIGACIVNVIGETDLFFGEIIVGVVGQQLSIDENCTQRGA